jgi:hypothetical protein
VGALGQIEGRFYNDLNHEETMKARPPDG